MAQICHPPQNLVQIDQVAEPGQADGYGTLFRRKKAPLGIQDRKEIIHA
ncbi:hypothetical protein [Desulfobacter sp.]|nr:hypothetical protein [Desulfobacter sp.]